MESDRGRFNVIEIGSILCCNLPNVGGSEVAVRALSGEAMQQAQAQLALSLQRPAMPWATPARRRAPGWPSLIHFQLHNGWRGGNLALMQACVLSVYVCVFVRVRYRAARPELLDTDGSDTAGAGSPWTRVSGAGARDRVPQQPAPAPHPPRAPSTAPWPAPAPRALLRSLSPDAADSFPQPHVFSRTVFWVYMRQLSHVVLPLPFVIRFIELLL